jgi:hypothetical protein
VRKGLNWIIVFSVYGVGAVGVPAAMYKLIAS